MKHETTTRKILEAAEKCSTAKETLKILFPDAFKEEYNQNQIIILERSDALSIIKRLETSNKFGLFSISRACIHWGGGDSFGTFDHCIEYAKNYGTIHAFDSSKEFHIFMANYYSKKYYVFSS